MVRGGFTLDPPLSGLPLEIRNMIRDQYQRIVNTGFQTYKYVRTVYSTRSTKDYFPLEEPGSPLLRIDIQKKISINAHVCHFTLYSETKIL